MHSFDVAVVGAGPAGSSAAYHLAKCGRQVLLLERYAFPRQKACGDGLTPKSIGLLTEMGLIEELVFYRKVYGVRVTMGSEGCRESMFHSRDVGRPSYGLVVPRHDLDHFTCQKAVEAGATLWEKTIVTGAVLKDDRICGIKVRRKGMERDILATFVVAADGGESRFARSIGLLGPDHHPRGYAVRGYYTGILDLDNLFMVYLPLIDPRGNRVVSGYGWVFPLTGSDANIGIGCFLGQQDFDVNLHRTFDHFVRDLRQKDARFAGMRLLGRLRGAPLHCGTSSSRCVGKGVVVVGDAAGLVNPFTGEGISNALESGKLAAKVLDLALESSEPMRADLGQYSHLLEEYYQDLFQADTKYSELHGFMWRLLESTFHNQRPLFASFRRAMIDWETEDKPHADLTLIKDVTWLEEPAILDDLKEVRDQLTEITSCDLPLLSKVLFNLLDPTGSSLRSTLLHLSGYFGELKNPAKIPVAVSIELAYLALKLHSSVLDDAAAEEADASQKSRRGINWGNMFAVMAGDYLLTKAHSLVVGVGYEVSQTISRALAEISIGNMWAVERAHNLDLDEDGYFEIIGKKTATFYDLACRLGAKVNGAPDPVLRLLAEYGRNIGMAFRLTNDVLDIMVDSEKSLEHPLARTLEDGFYTLPMICVLSKGDDRFRNLLAQKAIGEEEIEMALVILRGSDSLSYTWEKAGFFADRAKDKLGPLPHSPTKWKLAALADVVVRRVHWSDSI